MLRAGRVAVIVVVVVLVGAFSGCGRKQASAGDFAGHWTSSQWGEHYFSVDGSTVKVIYPDRQGYIVGTVDGDTFTGWWTQPPDRQPPTAGEVRFRLKWDADKRIIDGSWRPGTTGEFSEDWDLTRVDGTIPADVATQFSNASLFVPHP